MNCPNISRPGLPGKKRIVIKVGTSSLIYSNGKVNLHFIDLLARQISDLRNRDYQVILVSSGAIGVGYPVLGFKERPASVPYKQAAAAVGQGLLMNLYEKAFHEYGQTVAQVLLTKGDALNPKRYLHASDTLVSLLELGAVPIVNENDAVTADEIKIGDNDTLSATVASVADAGLLIILSDVDGLYTADPSVHSDAELIHEIPQFDRSLFAMAGGPGSQVGTGGMHTKLQAAEICVQSGIDMIIACSSEADILYRIMNGEEAGTLFRAQDVHPQMRKKALIIGADVKGKIFVDKGCRDALLEGGSSLLPVGMVRVEGDFREGDSLSVFYKDTEIGRGISHYDTEDARLICGHRTGELASALGHEAPYDTMIHRDYLIIMK